jgi:hypothetical protein
LQIHQRDIGVMLLKLGDGFTAIGSLGNHLHIRLTGDERRDAFANQGVIIDCENSNRDGFIAHELNCFLDV